MAGPFYYLNTLGNKVSTTVEINMCRKGGPQSFCGACDIPDQEGCKHREDSAAGATHCTYYRSSIDGACDSIWAQFDKENPNSNKKK
jgi:hypothetical protein